MKYPLKNKEGIKNDKEAFFQAIKGPCHDMFDTHGRVLYKDILLCSVLLYNFLKEQNRQQSVLFHVIYCHNRDMSKSDSMYILHFCITLYAIVYEN